MDNNKASANARRWKRKGNSLRKREEGGREGGREGERERERTKEEKRRESSSLERRACSSQARHARAHQESAG